MTRRKITIQAARWRIRLDAGLADLEALEAWLAQDAAHRREFDRLRRLWARLDEVRDVPALRSIRGALRRRVIARRGRTQAIRVGAMASAAFGIVLGVVLLGAAPTTQTYQTPSGVRRSVTLADGSRVLLDAGTELSVRYSLRRRDLTLSKGQARFAVMHESWRPFIVTAGARQVTATGTVFDIDKEGSTLTVSLLKGRVEVGQPHSVGDRKGSREVVFMRQGQQLVSSPSGVWIGRFDPQQASAWTAGRIIFRDARLDQAVLRLNRYGDRPFRVVDPAVASLKISGVFNAGDGRAFIEAVEAVLPVTAQSRPDGSIELARAPRCGPDCSRRPPA